MEKLISNCIIVILIASVIMSTEQNITSKNEKISNYNNCFYNIFLLFTLMYVFNLYFLIGNNRLLATLRNLREEKIWNFNTSF